MDRHEGQLRSLILDYGNFCSAYKKIPETLDEVPNEYISLDLKYFKHPSNGSLNNWVYFKPQFSANINDVVLFASPLALDIIGQVESRQNMGFRLIGYGSSKIVRVTELQFQEIRDFYFSNTTKMSDYTTYNNSLVRTYISRKAEKGEPVKISRKQLTELIGDALAKKGQLEHVKDKEFIRQYNQIKTNKLGVHDELETILENF